MTKSIKEELLNCSAEQTVTVKRDKSTLYLVAFALASLLTLVILNSLGLINNA